MIALGITNQRETIVLWDRRTHSPVYNAIVWQDKRGVSYCEELRRGGYSNLIRKRTGLVVDPYFSAPKIRWLLDNVGNLRTRAEKGEILFGTVDTYLLYRLTNGAVHATDYSNASRTMLFDTKKLEWDEELLKLFKIPPRMMPEVRPSAGFFGRSDSRFFGREITVSAMIGDQQASLFGQAAFKPGLAKNTYGTGCFVLTCLKERVENPPTGLLGTIAWGLGPNDVTYALEGSILVAGAAIQWLKDGVGLMEHASESERIALSIRNNDGVYFVPAFAGLGAPYWDPNARGLIIGITGGTTRAHLVRAALEGICFQTRDVFEAMIKSSCVRVNALRVDGGAAQNDFLMQFQADVLGTKVQRPVVRQTTSLGVAFLAGLKTGMWASLREVEKLWAIEREFVPTMKPTEREKIYKRWKEAVKRSRSWAANRTVT